MTNVVFFAIVSNVSQKETEAAADIAPARMAELTDENRQAVLRGVLGDMRRMTDDIRCQYPPGLERLERMLGVYGVMLDLHDRLVPRPPMGEGVTPESAGGDKRQGET